MDQVSAGSTFPVLYRAREYPSKPLLVNSEPLKTFVRTICRESNLLEVFVDQLGHLKHIHLFFAVKDLPELIIRIDHPFVLGVLQFIFFDISPQPLDHLSPW